MGRRTVWVTADGADFANSDFLSVVSVESAVDGFGSVFFSDAGDCGAAEEVSLTADDTDGTDSFYQWDQWNQRSNLLARISQAGRLCHHQV